MVRVGKWAVVLAFGFCSQLLAGDRADFVKVNQGHFEVAGKPYYFLGTNFWYGANLGAVDSGGDRPRLRRELDRLAKMGVKNLRILGLSEGPAREPWRIVPAAQEEPGKVREDALAGLDLLLAEMGARDMRAVICLSNFWPWSGGFAQYLAWSSAGSIPYPPPQPGGDWNVFQAFATAFYSNVRANELYRGAIAQVIERRNTITGSLYRDDPTIMAWQLANEPRGGRETAAFNRWIGAAADKIKSLDSNHLVTTGTEGETPWPEKSGLDLVANHSARSIDYATAHIWAQNWGWYDPSAPASSEVSLDSAIQKMRRYFNAHVERAKVLGKPLVVEEFGLARDEGRFDAPSPTSARDRYYREVFESVYQSARSGAPVSGVNFWAWGGEGAPRTPGGEWKPGDPFVGDPPHEAQGWYSVYAEDKSTLSIIGDYAAKMSGLKGTRPREDQKSSP